MSRAAFVLCAIALGGVLLHTPFLEAQEQEIVPEAASLDEVEIADMGWTGSFDVGANFALASNRSVVGQSDGISLSIGNALSGRAIYSSGQHQWRNTLRNSQTFTRTPLLKELVKTVDDFRVESIYYYRIPAVPWIGPFARVQLNTSLFKGYDVRAEEVTYVVEPEEEGGEESTVTDDRFQLTDPFSPLTLRESVGLFARPVEREAVTTDFRAGAGARQAFADGQFAIGDDGDEEAIEVLRLQSYQQIGAEIAAEIAGSFEDGRVRYALEAEALFPFYNSVDNDLSVLELTNVEVMGSVGYRMLEWMSLSYEFRIQRIPQLVDEWQISNNFLVSFSYGRNFGYEAE